MLKRVVFITAHLIFWVAYIAVALNMGFNISEGWDMFIEYYTIFLIHLVWVAIAFYSFYCYFSRYLLKQRKPWKYLVVSILSSAVLTYLFYWIIFATHPSMDFIKSNVLLYTSMLGTFFLIQCGTLVRAFINWYNQEELKSETEKAKLRNELAMLKSQISPHFLFNTLNNIDALVHDDPNRASQAIIRLSEILRYMLYETDGEYVKLNQEVKFLSNLVALHRLRHSSVNYIEFRTGIEDEGIRMAPLLLIPLVENAMKFASDAGKEPVVLISLESKNKVLKFQCSNYFNPEKNREETTGGIGLANVRQRLEAYYPERHQFEIRKKDDLYSVELMIKLD